VGVFSEHVYYNFISGTLNHTGCYIILVTLTSLAVCNQSV